MKLAKQIGLSVAEADLKKIEEVDYLLIKRFDRIQLETSNTVTRFHQEDFCQALGIPSTNKYQNEGGPSLKQCFDLVRKISGTPVFDLEKLINAVIFNFLIGNCDAHGKNFSVLYLDHIQFSPLYDLICTVYYKELDQRMAMKLGGEYSIKKITINNFDKLAVEASLAKPELRRRILEVIDAILSALPEIEMNNSVQKNVAKIIKSRCLDFRQTFTS